MRNASDLMGGMLALEEMASGDSWVHRLHPLAKLWVTAVYVVAVVSVGRLNYAALSIYFFYPALLIPLSGVNAGALIRRVLPALPLVLLAGLSNVFLEPSIMMTFGALQVSRGFVSLVVLLEKAALTVLAVLMLMATTNSAKLLSGLRAIGAPKVLLSVLMLSVRFLTLLAGEAGRMMRAYRLRANSPKGIRIGDMGSFVGQLLLRSVDRAERVYNAMKLRGYSGEFPVRDAGRLTASSAMYAALVSAAILFFRFFTLTDVMAKWF
jgi:cobalt/nickel transport system permease protein